MGAASVQDNMKHIYALANLVFIISLLICFLVIFCFVGDGVQLYSLCDGPIADGQD